MKIVHGKNNRDYIVQDPKDRFEKFIDKTEERCWNWKGGIDHDGYGVFWVKGKSLHASKWAWIFEKGNVPKGMYVLHNCDNPSCVRTSHLRLGTAKENSAERDRKGRQCVGTKHPGSKLTEEQVRQIRKQYLPKQITAQSLADEFHVSKKLILNIVRGLTWKHVT